MYGILLYYYPTIYIKKLQFSFKYIIELVFNFNNFYLIRIKIIKIKLKKSKFYLKYIKVKNYRWITYVVMSRSAKSGKRVQVSFHPKKIKQYFKENLRIKA